MKIDLTNKKVGRLTVIKIVGKNKHRGYVWECICKCGNKTTCDAHHLSREKIKSCGCLRFENGVKFKTHGMTKTRFYKIWQGVLYRCNKSTCPAYSYYGGRGIKCLWKTFEEFRDDMYESYIANCNSFSEKDTTLDRIDSDGNYCKENCRWSNRENQSNNRNNNILFTYNGETLNMRQWEIKLGFFRGKVHNYLKRGWSFEQIVTGTPPVH